MIQQNMIEDVVRQVLKDILEQSNEGAGKSTVTAGSQLLDPEKDYPLAKKRPDLVKTPTGKSLTEITLENVTDGVIKADDFRITPDTLRMQAEIAEKVGRAQFANNLRRAAELTAIPDQRILEIYNALRPYRSTKQELLEIAKELETNYNAKITAAFVREAADVYERRKRLRTE
ncbi:MAG: propanediol dehydratase small subunit [Clostridia bacterium]|nr:propanediol dehydratase small subunit [Clostridia bacterium]